MKEQETRLVRAGGPLRVFREGLDGEDEVNFGLLNVGDFFRDDIVRSRITGDLPTAPDYKKVNFVESILFRAKAVGTDFSECDFKDTLVKECIFDRCSFDNGTFATVFFFDCVFRECTFYNLAAHSCDFTDVTFDSCDLTNILVKSSRFAACLFSGCRTSNRIAEMSMLSNTSFFQTPIQIETITGNFGLRDSDLEGVQVRSGRSRARYQIMTRESIQERLSIDSLSAVERLRIEYFLGTDLRQGSQYLDRSLDLRQWTQVYKNPGSFVELLDKYSEFLMDLFESGEITFHPILLLHHVTSVLADSMPSKASFYRVAMSLGGTHAMLSRITEEYLEALELVGAATPRSLTFLAEGPLSADYFQGALDYWLSRPGIEIAGLRPRNSPLELTLTASDVALYLPIVAAFLATRTKFELIKVKRRLQGSEGRLIAGEGDGVSHASDRTETSLPMGHEEERNDEVLKIETGPIPTLKGAFGIRVRALLPGSLLAELQLGFNTGLGGKIREVLVDILDDS